jgi:hypothetical protein
MTQIIREPDNTKNRKRGRPQHMKVSVLLSAEATASSFYFLISQIVGGFDKELFEFETLDRSVSPFGTAAALDKSISAFVTA